MENEKMRTSCHKIAGCPTGHGTAGNDFGNALLDGTAHHKAPPVTALYHEGATDHHHSSRSSNNMGSSNVVFVETTTSSSSLSGAKALPLPQATQCTPPLALSETTESTLGSTARSQDDDEDDDDDRRTIPSLQENLMRKHRRRDPKEFFDEIEVLGEGSMGSVSKCRRKESVRGGSARPDFVRKQQGCCFQLISAPSSLFHYNRPGPKFVEYHSDSDPPPAQAVRPFRENSSSTSSSSDESSNKRDVGGYNSRRMNNNKLSLLWPPAASSLSTETTVVAASSAAAVNSSSRRHFSWPPQLPGSMLYQKSVSSGDYSGGSRKDVYYALKSIKLSRCDNEAFRNELQNEVQILKTLDHPHIVKAMETFQHKDQLYLVLEMCSGGDLYTRDPYTEQQAARIVKSLFSAVSYLHSKGIIHRDLKFENVMFATDAPDSEVKLIDFGLSQKFAANEHLTEQVGTIYTMAPEVLSGDYDTKADVWSLGVIAFMLLSSSTPFFARSRPQIVKKLQRGKYEFKARRWREVSQSAKDFVKELLQYAPGDRPTAEEALVVSSESSWLHREFNLEGRAPELDHMSDVERAIQVFADYGTLKRLALMVIAHKSTSEEVGFLRDLFGRFDEESRDGEIHPDEFKRAVKKMEEVGCGNWYSEEELDRMFRAMDIDGTGRVHYSEFLAATLEARGAIDEERLAEAFDRIDCDDTGYITASNLKDFLGEDIPGGYIDRIIAEADLLHDHRINYQEFLHLWSHEDDVLTATSDSSSDSSSE